MSRPAFLTTNFFTLPSVTINSNASIAAGMPLTNLQDPHPRVRTRITSAGWLAVWFDLLEPRAVDCFVLVSTTLEGSFSFRVRCSNIDPTASSNSVYNQERMVTTGPQWNGNIVWVFETTITARYWRFATSYVPNTDLGLVAIGPLWRPDAPFSFGFEEGYEDFSVRETNALGADFTVSRPRRRIIRATFDWLRPEEAGSMLADLETRLGAAGDLLFIPNVADDSATMNRRSIWGRWRAPGIETTTMRALRAASRTFTFVERL